MFLVLFDLSFIQGFLVPCGFLNNYEETTLQLWNTNEHEDLQVLVVISRPPIKVYVTSIIHFLHVSYFTSKTVRWLIVATLVLALPNMANCWSSLFVLIFSCFLYVNGFFFFFCFSQCNIKEITLVDAFNCIQFAHITLSLRNLFCGQAKDV